MQKIFYNARFLTLNEKFEEADAMLVNDDSIVFVGEKDEVLKMQTDETKLIDLNEKTVIPAFYDLNINVYEMIEKRLKNANKDKFIEKTAENNENYEIFKNFKIYQKEFESLQNDILEKGILTIHEKISSIEEFCFWKKIADSNVLKIDVIGYVDFYKHKQIMDDNCRSFRKYKNGFRLGGYYINLDGDILEKKAWLKKPYPKEGKYLGYAECTDEQLMFIIKTALEEKKQLIVCADGDRAVEQFVRCYEEQIKKDKVEDNYRPAVFGCNFVSKKVLLKMKELQIMQVFKIDELTKYNEKIRLYFGRLKSKKIIPFKILKKSDIKPLFASHQNEIIDNFKVMKYFIENNFKYLETKNKENSLSNLFESLILKAAFYSFDAEQKSSLESGKRADFLVLDKNINDNIENVKILEIYKNGENILKSK